MTEDGKLAKALNMLFFLSALSLQKLLHKSKVTIQLRTSNHMIQLLLSQNQLLVLKS